MFNSLYFSKFLCYYCENFVISHWGVSTTYILLMLIQMCSNLPIVYWFSSHPTRFQLPLHLGWDFPLEGLSFVQSNRSFPCVCHFDCEISSFRYDIYRAECARYHDAIQLVGWLQSSSLSSLRLSNCWLILSSWWFYSSIRDVSLVHCSGITAQ